MKKLTLSLISIFLFSIFFSSCIWVPKSDSSKIQDKSYYKKFNHLNEPILLPISVNRKFSLYGIDSLYSNVYNLGTVLAVYDWENDVIYDYVYTKENVDMNYYGSDSKSVAIKNSDGSCNFFTLSGGYVHVEMMKANSIVLDNDRAYGFESHVGWAKLYTPANRYVLLYNNDYNYDSNSTMQFSLYDSEYKSVGRSFSLKTSDYNLSKDFAVDPNGDYWLSYTRYDKDSDRNYTDVRKFDSSTCCLDEVFCSFDNNAEAVYDSYDGWSKTSYYHLRHIDDEYLVFIVEHRTRAWDYTYSIAVVDRSSKAVSYINPGLKNKYILMELLEIDGKLYALEAYKNEKYNLIEISPSEKTAVSLNADIEFKYQNFIEIRGSRLYFFGNEDEFDRTRIFRKYYDVKDRKTSEIACLEIQ